MAAAGIPGASIAVVRNFDIAWAAGFGDSNRARQVQVTPETLFQAASVSKPIAALAMLIALNENRLGVDTPVNDLLRQFSGDASIADWRLPNPFAKPVTIRMLLAHTAGTSTFRYKGYRYGYQREPPGPIDALPTIRDELLGLPPANTPAIETVREPGTQWAYSPAGYTIIQAALMNIYGKPFAAIMDELVLKPLRLDDSTFAQPTPALFTRRVAIPYLDANEAMPDGPRVFIAAASGGLTSTPRDLAKLVIAVQKALAGTAQGRITPEIARAALERQPGMTAPEACFPSDVTEAKACRSSWGLGFDVNLTKHFGHAPDTAPTGGWFGHSGFNSGYLAVMLGSKAGGNGVVIMLNVAPEDMSGDVPQWGFLMKVVRRIADEEGW
ncbi:MAG: beta-lactamase family protein, partial [Rhizobiales bacterium]|nr:beta-lactamase family protein [Hyphomicrobiales bacterium]